MRAAEPTSYNIRSTPYYLFPAFIKNTAVFIAEKMDAYGDFFEVKVPGREILAVANADVLQHMLLRNETNYVKSRYYWQQLKAIIGNALGTLEGDEWLLMRKLHAKALGNAKTTTYLFNINTDIHNYLHQWKAYENSTVDIIALFAEMNVAILLQALFGYENKAICATIASLVGAGQKHILWRSKYPWRPFLSHFSGKDRRYDSSLIFFENLAIDIFENRTNLTGDIEKLVDILIKKSDHAGSVSFIKELRSELIVYLGAGTETAAVGLGWIIYLLAKNRDKLDCLRADILKVTGGNPVRADHLSDLVYADYVVKEGLRLYSPSHTIARDALEDDYINGITIHKGASVFISSYALHRNPAYWRAPLDFIPERFEAAPVKYSYIPFGAGRHTCIGRYLATPMLVLTLASFVQQFDFELEDDEVPLPESGSTLKPRKPILITLKTLN
ncbi:MAG: cytochrome P450 [Terrimonas sp.]|nr:cytochrome P450 [Terrimonas sp.]OJY84784.1 MAG: hypothetical protein BGP13_20090 [Sphingobacteriales bacterium 40-81]